MAVLQGRTDLQEFECPGLAFVELRCVVRAFGASLYMKINGQAAGAGECVWEACAGDRAWQNFRSFADLLADDKSPGRSLAPESPWLAVAFTNEVYRHLSQAQVALAVAVLWGRAYHLRRKARLLTCLN